MVLDSLHWYLQILVNYLLFYMLLVHFDRDFLHHQLSFYVWTCLLVGFPIRVNFLDEATEL